MSWSLEGRTAVITGASRGIGRAVAETLAAAGVQVVLGARSLDDLSEVSDVITSRGGRAISLRVDVTRQDDTTALARAALETFGSLDIVVANAGRETTSLVRKSDVTEWTDTITTNVVGTYLTVHAALPHLRAAGGGVILIVGSGMGHQHAAGRSAYGASKAAVSHLAATLSLETWRDGIAVNELVPGPVHTAMTADRWHLGEAPKELPSERVKPAHEVGSFVQSLLALGPQGPTGQVFSLARRPL